MKLAWIEPMQPDDTPSAPTAGTTAGTTDPARTASPAAEPDAPIEFAPLMREIGRGKDGARPLDAARMRALFDLVFSGRLAELELGALLIALRMKGETVEEIEGALQALGPHLNRVPVDPARPAVSIPSYNGARRSANLTALLACLLADAGVQVVVHGVVRDPSRTTTAEVMQAMGLAIGAGPQDARRAIARGDPAFLPVEALSPPLAVLLALRWRLGVRNIGHTLAKLLDPTDSPACLRIAAYTHPEFNALQHALLERSGAAALVLRGTEGEVVASTRRAARLDWVHDGLSEPLTPAHEGPLREVPDLPPAHDASATALWIQSVLAGERPVPGAIAQQVDAVLRALGAAPKAAA